MKDNVRQAKRQIELFLKDDDRNRLIVALAVLDQCAQTTGETAGSDLYGIVLNAAFAAMDGCPWIEKGRVAEIADGITEAVTDRLSEVESVTLTRLT